jgi:tetratricopeptide (TPR) repeat protein
MSIVVRKLAAAKIAFSVVLAFVVCLTAAAQATNPQLADADAAMKAGRFADASRAYETWLKAHPDSDGVLLALGICYVQLGRRTEAVATLRRYVKHAPGSATGHAALGIALLDGLSTAEAKAELAAAIRINPKQADAAEALARIHLLEGKPGDAVSLLRPLATSGASDDTRTLLANAMVKAGQAQAAGALLEREITSNPRSSAQIYAVAAWAYFKASDLDKTADLCERGMRIYPDSEIEEVYLGLPAPFLAQRIGARIKALQEAPDAAELVAVGRVLLDADQARKTRANEIGQRMLSHAIQLAPDNASAHYHLGRALSQTNLEQALAEWDKALASRPTDELRVQILTNIGAAKLDSSDPDAAERAFREALEVNRRLARRNPVAMLEYVRFLQLKSRTDEAEVLLDEVLSWNPLSPQAHLERAKLLAARKQWDKVAERAEFVLQNAGDDEDMLRTAHGLLARAYMLLKQPEKAEVHRSWIESH